MNNIKLYRKRLIPFECKLLDSDVILHLDEDILVTKWDTIRPKKILHHGLSCYFFKEGYKISKFYDKDNDFICWYCDIIEHEYNEEEHTFTFVDLLADVIVYPDRSHRVVDLNELADAFEQKLISQPQLLKSLHIVDKLLHTIYNGKFHELTFYVEKYEKEL